LLLLGGGGVALAGSPNPDNAWAAKFLGVKVGVASGKALTIGVIENVGSSGYATAAGTGTAAKDYINKVLDGVNGHPVKLDVCTVVTAEDAQSCGESMANNPHVSFVVASAIQVDDTAMLAALSKKPVILAADLTPPEFSDSNAYSFAPPNIAFTSVVVNLVAKLGGNKGKAVAFVGNTTADGVQEFDSISAELKSAGVKNVTEVSAPTNATEPQFVTAVQASNAGSAPIFIALQDDAGCINIFDALTTLGDSPKAIISPFTCLDPTVTSKFGGTLPKNFNIIDLGDSPYVAGLGTGINSYLAAMKKYSPSTNPDGASHLFWSALMTADELANKVGFTKIKSSTMKTAIAKFKGPVWMEPGPISCGYTTKAVSACAQEFEDITYNGSTYVESPLTAP
jgi:branched-chain amino acid transport system substrate-binding protein